MVDIATFHQLARSLPETSEQPHFEKPSFRVGKKMFATLDLKNEVAWLKLNEVDQYVFSAFDKSTIFPVPNKWGKQGWTFVKLEKVHPDMLAEALTTAYCEVAPKKLAALVRPVPAD